MRIKFDSWATRLGVIASTATLPVIQSGLAPVAHMGFVAYNLKAFSKARKLTPGCPVTHELPL